MRKVGLYSLLLILGLVLSQFVLPLIGQSDAESLLLRLLTMTALAFIMIRVGFQFDIDKKRVGDYAFDYFVAMTAAAIPWILCTLYFVFVMASEQAASLRFWNKTMLLSRFAAPTSAGVLFSMLAAAGLGTTWVFRKAQVLAILDDVDTILLLIPLQMLMVGLKWQLGIMIIVIPLLLWAAWRFLHELPIGRSWPSVLMYALGLASICEGVDQLGQHFDPATPLRLEVLLPAFVLGCLTTRPRPESEEANRLDGQAERRVSTIVSACFMLLAGASLPRIPTGAAPLAPSGRWNAFPGWDLISLHVAAITLLSNLGKMFPALCYRREATWRQRLALGVSMFPRGEVGIGVLVISTAYGIGGVMLTAAMLSLVVNLVATGVFIVVVKRLLAGPTIPNAE